MNEALTGGCNCGAVKFEVTTPPIGAGYCHCTRCQRRTGTSSSASALLQQDSLRVTAGEELVKSWNPADGAEKCFCGECGSQLWAKLDGDPPNYAIRMGAFDSDPGVRPLFRQYVRSAVSWEDLPEDGLPRFETTRPPDYAPPE